MPNASIVQNAVRFPTRKMETSTPSGNPGISSFSRTWPVGLQLMVGEFQLPWGPLSAGGIISIVPIVLFFALVQQSLIRGLTSGAVKG